MDIKIKKWGSSAGITLAKPILELLHVKIGSHLHVEIYGDQMILTKGDSKKHE